MVLGDLSVRRGTRAPISGSRRVRRSCFSEARRGVTLQPARQGDRQPPCTCCYIVFLCESRPVLALRAVQCFFRPLRAFPVAAGWGLGAGGGLRSYTSISGWACVPDGAESEFMHLIWALCLGPTLSHRCFNRDVRGSDRSAGALVPLTPEIDLN
eukprot:COSAG02_NODE_2418_length_8905_cov_5.021576_3_plen_155_part_00